MPARDRVAIRAALLTRRYLEPWDQCVLFPGTIDARLENAAGLCASSIEHTSVGTPRSRSMSTFKLFGATTLQASPPPKKTKQKNTLGQRRQRRRTLSSACPRRDWRFAHHRSRFQPPIRLGPLRSFKHTRRSSPKATKAQSPPTRVQKPRRNSHDAARCATDCHEHWQQ